MALLSKSCPVTDCDYQTVHIFNFVDDQVKVDMKYLNVITPERMLQLLIVGIESPIYKRAVILNINKNQQQFTT